MERDYEQIHEVLDYLDRPLKGIANYRGVPHRFCSVGWISPPHEKTAEWEVWRASLAQSWDVDENRYGLTPVNGSDVSVWVRGVFQGARTGIEPPRDDPQPLRVWWRPIRIQERLDRLVESQRLLPDDSLDTPGNVCVSFHLEPADLKLVQHDLRRRDPELALKGEVGCYRSVPVFPVGNEPRQRTAENYYQGIWFTSIAMDATELRARL